MGIRDAVSSTADSLKKRLPDPEPVKNAVRSAYSTATSGLPVYSTMRDALMKKDAKTTRNISSEQEIQEIWGRIKRLEAESLPRGSQPSVSPRHRIHGPHLRSRL
ncbi:uncharacterized protein A4U43_C03F23010 [Asparagus officinalis]|uniref:Uncharacterized protein n=1 Tax=Asparagus officinalis TaxID=4686 RepID=A0A5P1FH98_ASPOF|nr:uncharacterized protein A4U43_C03F23010 [Asparagus officinalis]